MRRVLVFSVTKMGGAVALIAALWLAVGSLSGPAAAQNGAETPSWWRGASELGCFEQLQGYKEMSAKGNTPYFNCQLAQVGSPYQDYKDKAELSFVFGNHETESNAKVMYVTISWWADTRLRAPSDALEPWFRGANIFFYDKQEATQSAAKVDPNRCPGALKIADDLLYFAEKKRLGSGSYVSECRIGIGGFQSVSRITLQFDVVIPGQTATPAKPSACTTDQLHGEWKAQNPVLTKTGHGLTIGAAPAGIGPHDGGQKEFQGTFAVHPSKSNLLALLPNPLYSFDRAYDVAGGQCLIPIVSQRDSGTPHSALLYNPKANTLRFVNEQAYRRDGNGEYTIYPITAAHDVVGVEGTWVRGTPAPDPEKVCTAADMNGAWHRPDGAQVNLAGIGSYKDGGNGAMVKHPGFWLQSQMKFTAIKKVRGCTYTAMCYTTERKYIDGRANYNILEDECTLEFDPAAKTMTASKGHGQFRRTAYPPPPPPAAKAPVLKTRTAVSEADYPFRAVREEVSGSVLLELTIGTNGRVIDCKAIEANPPGYFEEASCKVWYRRAVFTPAEDSNGNVVEGKSQQRMKWGL